METPADEAANKLIQEAKDNAKKEAAEDFTKLQSGNPNNPDNKAAAVAAPDPGKTVEVAHLEEVKEGVKV
jgi:hypothetical protein